MNWVRRAAGAIIALSTWQVLAISTEIDSSQVQLIDSSGVTPPRA